MKSRKDYYSKPEAKAKHLECQKRYYEKHKEEIKSRRQKYYQKNKEVLKNNNKLYRQTPDGKAANKKSARKVRLKKLYNLTLEQYDEMLTAQLSGCSICNKTIMETGKLLVVDHNHITGKVRDLLCDSCNQAIGLFYENPDLLRKAIEYIEKYN